MQLFDEDIAVEEYLATRKLQEEEALCQAVRRNWAARVIQAAFKHYHHRKQSSSKRKSKAKKKGSFNPGRGKSTRTKL